MKKILLTAFIALSTFILLPGQAVQAQIGICTFIKPICDAIGIDDDTENAVEAAENFIVNRGRLILGLLFVGITLMAIFIIVQAGIKYIQSQGDEGKIAEAQKAIKSVFVGIAILIVGVVGVLLVLFFLGGGQGFLSLGNNGDPIAQCIQRCVNDGGATTKCTADCSRTGGN